MARLKPSRFISCRRNGSTNGSHERALVLNVSWQVLLSELCVDQIADTGTPFLVVPGLSSHRELTPIQIWYSFFSISGCIY